MIPRVIWLPQLQINNGGISPASSNHFFKFKAQRVAFPLWATFNVAQGDNVTQTKEEVKMFGKEQEDGGVKGK